MAFGLWSLDWAQGIDWDELRRGRLERARAAMKRHGLDALVLFETDNIRYVSGTIAGRCPEGSRYCILPGDNPPHVFELGGDVPRVEVSSPWMSGRVHAAVPLKYIGEKHMPQWADQIRRTLEDEGVAGGLIGVDTITGKRQAALEKASVRFAEAGPAMTEARMIKTPTEVECVRAAVSLGSACFAVARETIKPGIREIDVQIAMHRLLLSHGADGLAVIASGQHTNPYWRITLKDKLIEAGDLIIIDRIHVLNGYHSDFVRTFLCGDRATAEQKEIYKICYDEMYAAIEQVGPGVSTADIAKKLQEATDYTEITMKFGHGLGLHIHEPPYITFMAEDDPAVLQPNMVLAIETYTGRPGGRDGVRLEEILVVTPTGYEILSRYPFDERLMSW